MKRISMPQIQGVRMPQIHGVSLPQIHGIGLPQIHGVSLPQIYGKKFVTDSRKEVCHRFTDLLIGICILRAQKLVFKEKLSHQRIIRLVSREDFPKLITNPNGQPDIAR
jgi:hypothetical protein